MATKTPPKPRNKPTPSAVISREELDAAEAEDNVGGPNLANVEIYRDQALKLLLHPDGQAAMRWKEFAATNPDNVQLGNYLKRLWTPAISRDTPPCAASAGMGTALVWFGQSHTKGSPSLSGYELCEAVRRVLQMPDPEDAPAETRSFQEIKATGKSRAKFVDETIDTPAAPKPKNQIGKPKPAEKISAANLLAGVEVISEQDLAISLLFPSADNPRESFDETLIAEMSKNITTICQLNPITVRELAGSPNPGHEILDGETRYRAALAGKAKAIRAKIIRCTHAQAACLRLLTTVQRRDLNPIERAKGLKALQEQHDISQRQLSDLVKLEQGSISNLTRLLDLPDFWQKLVISGEITASAARDLIPWTDETKVLAELEDMWKNVPEDERTAQVLKEALDDAIRETSDDVPRGMKFSDEQRQQLRIRTVKYSWGGSGERCFNTELLQQLVEAREAKRRAREEKQLDRKTPAAAAKTVDPKKAAENAKKQKEMFARKIYKFRVAWYQAMLVDQMEDVSDSDMIALLMFLSCGHGNAERSRYLEKIVPLGKEKSKLRMTYHGTDPLQLLSGLMKKSQEDEFAIGTWLQKLLVDQLSQKFDAFNNVVDPEEFELLAKHFDIDIKRDWTTSFEDGAAAVKLWDQFCSLWNRDQIIELLKEWKITNTAGESAKRGDLVKLLTTDKGCPKAIINAEAVRLT